MFPGKGDPWQGITGVFVGGSSAPTHFVDVTETISAGGGVPGPAPCLHRGLGHRFDPDRFLRDMAGYDGMAAGCDYAVVLQRFPGLTIRRTLGTFRGISVR